MVDQDPAQRGSQPEQRRRNPLQDNQALRDRGDWPQIEANMWQRGWESLGRFVAVDKAEPTSDNVLDSPLSGFIPNMEDPDFDAFMEYISQGKASDTRS